MSKSAKFFLTLLFILVGLSLGLNIFLLWQLQRLEQQARNVTQNLGTMAKGSLDQAITDLEAFQEAKIDFNVRVNEDFPVQVDIPFKETLDVPIQLTIPISQEIKTTVLLDPLKTGQGIPVDVAMPVNIDVPIDTSIPISIDRTIPISTTVPLNLDVPITVNLGETDLSGYIGRLHDSLVSFNAFLDQTLSGLEQ